MTGGFGGFKLNTFLHKIIVLACSKIYGNYAEARRHVKLKAKKDGLDVKNELEHFAQIGWEAVEKEDLETRLKWLGVFYRPVTPGKFMLRMRGQGRM